MTISAVLINHNGLATILRVIQSILNQKQECEKIILVDNGSRDGSVEAVRKNYPIIQIIELRENRGLPYARNIGLSHIQSDLVLFVDDDVLLTTGCLDQMMSAMSETQASVICPRIVLHPENNVLQCDGAAVHFAGMLSLHHAYEEVENHPPKQSMTNGFIGACMLFDTNILRSLGGFDEDYFFYFEDMELSYRFIAFGYKICCQERAVVLHERGVGTENLSFRGTGNYPLPRAYFNFRHRWLTLLIHYQIKTLILLSPALFLYEVAAFVESIRRGWLLPYFQAFFSILTSIKSVFHRRKKWQSLRIVSDKEILIGGKLPFSRGFIEPKKSKLINVFEILLNLYWDVVKKWL